jgi:hypothetical protein
MKVRSQERLKRLGGIPSDFLVEKSYGHNRALYKAKTEVSEVLCGSEVHSHKA